MTLAIDTGFPKKILKASEDIAGDYDSIFNLSMCRDISGNFWLAGGARVFGESYCRPHVWKFDSNWTLLYSWQIDGGVLPNPPNNGNSLAIDIVIRSDWTVHIVINYFDSNSDKHLAYSGFNGGNWSVPIQIDNPSVSTMESPSTYNTDIEMSVGRNDDILFSWTSRGHIVNWPSYDRITARILKADGTWTSILTLIGDNPSQYYHIGSCAMRNENKFYLVGARVTYGQDASYIWKVESSGGSILSSLILSSGHITTNGQGHSRRSVFEGDNGGMHMLIHQYSSPSWYSRYYKNDFSSNHLVNPGNSPTRSPVFNETEARYYHVYSSASNVMLSRKHTLLAGIGGGWSPSSRLDQTDKWTNIAASLWVSSPTAIFPIYRGVRPSILKTGFLWSTYYTGNLLGDGETDSCLYIFASDNHSWPDPWITLDNAEIVASPASNNKNPSIAIDSSGNVHLTWEEEI